MKPTTKRLLDRFEQRRKLYPKATAKVGRKTVAELDKRARRQFGNGPARKGLYLK